MDTRLLELLVCPITKGPLDYDLTRQELISRSARLAYPIRDGIPVMLEGEARTVTEEELAALPATAVATLSDDDVYRSHSGSTGLQQAPRKTLG
jgi:uncharacterized protein YbaR (Trm112 family)